MCFQIQLYHTVMKEKQDHIKKGTNPVGLLRSIFIGCYLHGDKNGSDIFNVIMRHWECTWLCMLGVFQVNQMASLHNDQVVQSFYNGSFFAFNHDDMVAKLCFHWRIRVHRFIHSADG